MLSAYCTGVPGDRVELNAKIASAMGSPVLMSLDMRPGVSPEDAANSAAIARDTIQAAGARVLGLVLDRVSSSVISLRTLRMLGRHSQTVLELPCCCICCIKEAFGVQTAYDHPLHLTLHAPLSHFPVLLCCRLAQPCRSIQSARLSSTVRRMDLCLGRKGCCEQCACVSQHHVYI